MNIEIADEEYGTLLELLYMAEWALTAYKEPDKRTERYVGVIQKFYALAKGTPHAGSITYDDDLEKYLPAKRMEEASEARRLLDEFADEAFWHELIFRFTERDLERSVGGHEKMIALNPDERFEIETPIEEKYIEEFGEHGIERLEVVEQFGPDGTKTKTSD